MDKDNSTDTGMAMSAIRQSARDLLKEKIARLRSKADSLQAIADMLPANPTPTQDQALRSLLLDMPSG